MHLYMRLEKKETESFFASLRAVEEETGSRGSGRGGERNQLLFARVCTMEEGTGCFLPFSDLSSLPLVRLSFYSVSFCCSKGLKET